MATHIFKLESFEFPDDIPAEEANFRFIVEFRYIDPKDNLCTHTVVMPGLDSYFECDKSKINETNNAALYVRDGNTGKFLFGNKPKAVSEWHALITGFSAKSVQQVQFTVFDVDRKNWYEKLAGKFESLKLDISGLCGGVPALVGTVAALILKEVLEEIAAIKHCTLWRGIKKPADITFDNVFGKTQRYLDNIKVQISHEIIG